MNDFKKKVLGIIQSSKDGPRVLGASSANPLVVGYIKTIKELEEIRGFVSPKVFYMIIEEALTHLKLHGETQTIYRLKQHFPLEGTKHE